MKIRTTIAAVVFTLSALASGAQGEDYRNFRCLGPTGPSNPYIRDGAKAIGPNNLTVQRIVYQLVYRWDAAEWRKQCEAFAAGEPYEISCVDGRRDWQAIASKIPADLLELPQFHEKLKAFGSKLVTTDTGGAAALEYCESVGALTYAPGKWHRVRKRK